MMPSVKELRKICQPTKDVWWARYIFRPISIYITKILLHTPISSNQVTVLWFLTGIASGTLFIFGNYWCSIAGALLLQAILLLDCVDGEVARYRATSSLKGEYLDRLGHNITYPYIFVGISFGVYANFHDIRAFIFGFSASLFFLLIRLIEYQKSDILCKAGGTGGTNGIITTLDEQRSKSGIYLATLARRIRGKIVDPTDIYIIMIAILIGAIFNWLHTILIMYGILLPCRWLLQAVFNLKYRFYK